MRSRLFFLSALSSCLVLLVLGVSIVPLMRPKVTERLDQELREPILAIAIYILNEIPTDEQIEEFLAPLDTSPDHRLGVVSSSGVRPMGSDAARLGRYFRDPNRQRNLNRIPPEIAQYLYPRFFVEPNGDRVASQGFSDGVTTWVVEGTIPAEVIARHERNQWIEVAALAVLALVISLGGAALLARRITRPISGAIRVAEALGQGDLRAAPPTTGPKEVVELGEALAQLADRMDRLLAGERERAANLSHRLRTPLTVLRLEVERLEPVLLDRDVQRMRLHAAVAELERGLDDVIRESRRTRTAGLRQQADAGAVLQQQMDFWRVIADSQGREVTVQIPVDPVPVDLAPSALGEVLDSILGNIYRHTPPGVGYRASVRPDGDLVTIEVVNGAAEDPSAGMESPGSTGVGLEIAAGLITAAGGNLAVNPRHPEGFGVVVRLPQAKT